MSIKYNILFKPFVWGLTFVYLVFICLPISLTIYLTVSIAFMIFEAKRAIKKFIKKTVEPNFKKIKEKFMISYVSTLKKKFL